MIETKQLRKPDPQGIFVVDNDGNMKWLPTPFSAYCTEDIGSVTADSLVYIEEVGYTAENDLVFVIGSTAYYHHYFIVDSSY